MRLPTVFLTFLLILTACAPAAGQTDPTSVPVKQATAPSDAAPESPAVIAKSSFETSLLATQWKGDQEGNVLFPLDPASGAALPGYTPIPLGQSFSHAFSPNRHTLAALSFPNQYAHDGSLLLIDLFTWKTQRFELDLDGWVSTMVFSPDGKQLAVAHGESSYQLTMINVEQGLIMAQREIDAYVTRLKFTESGEALMLYTPAITLMDGVSSAPPQALLLDAADLNPLWSAELEGVRDGIFPTDENISQADLYEPGNAVYLSPGLTFAPDWNALYIVHADAGQLTTVDFENQHVETVEIQTKLTWFERLLSLTAGTAHAKIADGTSKQAVVSSDGEFLYVVGATSASFQDKLGNLQMEQTPLGLEIIHTSDGSRVEHIETDATELSLTPDGRFLYVRNWGDNAPWTEIYDMSNRQLITRKTGIFAMPALLMNGEFVLASTYSTSETAHHMSVLKPDGSSMLAEWTGTESVYWLSVP